MSHFPAPEPRPSLPFTLYPRRRTAFLILLLCLGFTAIGVVMIRKGDWMGWLCGGFFGLCLATSIVQLLPGASFLTVSDEGLEICTLFRKSRLRWADVAEFGVYKTYQNGLPVNTSVGINFAPDYKSAPKARAIAQALAGFEGSLPDTYGLKADKLAELLNELHREKTRGKNG